MPVSQLATRLLLRSQSPLVAVRSLSSMLKPVTIHQIKVPSNIKHGAFFHTQNTQLIYSTCKLCSAEKVVDSGSKEHIKSLVDKRDVVVFMKGVPEQPMCGYSNAVVQILRMHGVEYDSYNVLDDENLRAGIKTYSEWPTIPQIYLKGEFVGGCDILLQMHQSGDFIEELKSIGIRSALLDKENEK